jgi:hypothetical protein
MPLRLNVGLNKKVGLPAFGSVEASCHVELELDQALLSGDLEGFQQKVRNAFIACNQAVKDELYRQQVAEEAISSASYERLNGTDHHNQHAPRSSSSGHAPHRNGTAHPSPRKATASQARALEAIAAKQQFNLATLLNERFSADSAQDLSISQASELIDELNSHSPQKGR